VFFDDLGCYCYIFTSHRQNCI